MTHPHPHPTPPPTQPPEASGRSGGVGTWGGRGGSTAIPDMWPGPGCSSVWRQSQAILHGLCASCLCALMHLTSLHGRKAGRGRHEHQSFDSGMEEE